jgi:hypothetical protein
MKAERRIDIKLIEVELLSELPLGRTAYFRIAVDITFVPKRFDNTKTKRKTGWGKIAS